MYESSPLQMTSFIVLSGVAEEWMFRTWLCGWIHKFTHSVLLAVGASSAVWAFFHVGRVAGGLVSVSPIMYIGMFLLLLTGVVLSYIFVGFKVEPFNLRNIGVDFLVTVVAFASIFYVNSLNITFAGQWSYLVYVFLAGLPLGYLTLTFRSADGATFGHMLVNFLSGGA